MSTEIEINEYGKQKYFDKYYDVDSIILDNCCVKCLKKCTKHIIKQIFKLFIFFTILTGLLYGIYWGSSELIALNNFNQVEGGCTIVSFVGPVNGTQCNECNCEFLYNPFSLSRQKICDSCDGIKYDYVVTSDKCGEKLLYLDNDYYDDLSCGNTVKIINNSYDCYLYGDCRNQYSFDTMYADKNEFTLPIITVISCSILFITVLILKCLCC